MIYYAEQGNRVKRINEDEIAKYVEQGYVITDNLGNVIKDAIPNDTANLRLAYKKHTDEIAKLKKENAELKLKLQLIANATPVKKVEKPVEEPKEEQKEEVEQPEEKPKTRGKKSAKSE